MKFRLPGLITKDVLAMAFDSIRSNKFRSALTVLGIVIGILTALSVAAILMGLRGNLVKIVEEYGVNNIYVFHLSTGIQLGERDQEERARKVLTPEDGEAVMALAPAVEDLAFVSPNIGYYGGPFDDTISYNGKTYRRGNTQGVTPNHANISNVKLKEGRFISEHDDQFRRNVMVLGVNAAQALFPDQPDRVVGTEVKMGGYVWEVIGVLEKRKNAFMGENEEDNAVLVPFRTGLQVAPARRFLLFIVQAKPGLREAAIDQIEEILRARRRVKFEQSNDFDVKAADAFISQFDSIFGMVGLIAIAISSVGLLSRRHRRDEHHARLRHRADAGDRHPQGRRRAPHRHRQPVPLRGDDPDALRRHPRRPHLVRRELDYHVLRAEPARPDSHLGGRHGPRRLRLGRPRLRRLARPQGFAP